ncbi:serine/arginine-rich splicing factor SR45a isoform X2 [Selaginella moellendorffii]|uniref:serine/arginine-rich splicing factor SR45a isoform X2 n=1 Tax=Selaginella moellendorffii TaxID=88036 RepID=UPI000D1CA113|nr:serine/arginine-rich splicing factor SR45a isoform X2 [Selaginella moellendorffii]|eukprot:XP_024535340.1 serine/arginine-rich splicing factor SR45a isoform X2 [Selaginella moellendorffii]
MSGSPRRGGRRYSYSPSPRRGRSRSRSPPHCRSYRSDGRDKDDEISCNPGNNLYVTGLSTRVTEKDLEDYFSKEGKVVECRLVVDPRSHESRGFGFVALESLDDAERCIKRLHHSNLEGRIITVEKARRSRARTPTPGKYLGSRTAAGGGGRSHGRRHDDRDHRDDYYRAGNGGGGGYHRRSPRYSPYRRSPRYSPYRDYDRSYSPPPYRHRREYDRSPPSYRRSPPSYYHR